MCPRPPTQKDSCGSWLASGADGCRGCIIITSLFTLLGIPILFSLALSLVKWSSEVTNQLLWREERFVYNLAYYECVQPTLSGIAGLIVPADAPYLT